MICGCSPDVSDRVQCRQLLQIGSEGSSPGQFLQPRGLYFAPNGNLIVSDFRNFRIQEIQTDGRWIQSWGEEGDGPGQFKDPTCALLDKSGNLYVVDTWNHRVQKRTPNGSWNPSWAQSNDFYAPRGITIDSLGRIYVSNTSYDSVKVFNPAGKQLASWGGAGGGWDQVKTPIGLAIGPEEKLYIADTGNHRIKILDLTGRTLKTIPVPDWNQGDFNEAYLAVGIDGRIYATAPSTHSIVVFSPDGTIYSRFGNFGNGPEQLANPTGIAVDPDNNIFVSDTMNHRIVKYAPPPPLIVKKNKSFSLLALFLQFFRILVDLLAVIIIVDWILKRKKQKQYPLKTNPPAASTDNGIKSHIQRFIHRIQNSPKIMKGSFYIGLGGLIFATLFFRLKFPYWGSLFLLTTLIFLFLSELARNSDSIRFPGNNLSKNVEILGVLLLIIFSVWIRFYKITEIPWGINNDAAWNGIYALRILDGEPYTPFTAEAWGKSTFYFYLIAACFKLFGVSTITLYLPCIISGSLSVVLIYYLYRHLINNRFALVTAFIYSAMAWNLVFSRTGYRAILAPLCLCGMCLFYYLGEDAATMKRKLLHFSICGFFAGLGLHTYFAFRGIPLFILIMIGHSSLTSRSFIKRNWAGLLSMIAIAFLIFSPLFIFAMHDWETFVGRSDFLFIGNKIATQGSINPLLQNILASLRIFHYKAQVGNFFIPIRPILSLPLSIFFTIGFIGFLRAIWKRPGFITLLIFSFGILPSMLSEPDAARAIMTPIAIAAAGALGIFRFVEFLPKFFNSWKSNVVIILTAWHILAGYHYYFHFLGKDFFAQFGYARSHTLIGMKAKELSLNNEVYISQGHFIDTPKFICYQIPGKVFSITDGEVIDAVPDEVIFRNLNTILNSYHESTKGLAFVFENLPKNEPLLALLKSRFPNGQYQEYRDDKCGDEVIFYTFIVPPR